MGILDFDYSVTRTYTHRWFKWSLLVGGICLLVFFTSINLASNGYELQLTPTQNVNGTLNEKRWTRFFPFHLLDHTSTTCPSLNIAFNTRFWTNKLALPYTLVSAWQSSTDRGLSYSASIPYLNNTLENCVVWYIQINLDTTEYAGVQLIAPWNATAVPEGTGLLAWSPRATAFVNCTIITSNGLFNVTLSAEYAKLVAAGKMSSFPNQPERESSSSLWWGESMLSWYWSNLTKIYYEKYVSGAVNLVPRVGSEPITSTNFFHVAGYWFQKAGTNEATTWWAGNPSDINQIGTGLDYFGKAMYATVLADLGQTSSYSDSNALLDPKLLANISAPITNLAKMVRDSDWITAGPAQQSFTPSTLDHLKTTPSQIYADYQCQVPVLKSWGSLLISVLVADLVLLQAAWAIFRFAVTMWQEKTDPYANYCVGCIRLKEANPGMADLDKPYITTRSSIRISRSSMDLPLIEAGKAQRATRSDTWSTQDFFESPTPIRAQKAARSDTWSSQDFFESPTPSYAYRKVVS